VIRGCISQEQQFSLFRSSLARLAAQISTWKLNRCCEIQGYGETAAVHPTKIEFYTNLRMNKTC
jgi:hypothetical protein